MKLIRKRREPRRLRAWKRLTKKFVDASYDSQQFPKDEVKKSLIEEQGSLCAYTMIRIDMHSSHIEHLKPRTVSRAEGKLEETADYANNLVACFPKTGLAETPICPFGAVYRESNWDDRLFITPLDGTCESRFHFHTTGEVSFDEGDEPAQWTCEKLNLNEPSLVALRRAEILRRGLSLNAECPVGAEEARQIAEHICTATRGVFEQFCVTLRYAALEYAHALEKKKQQRKFATQSKLKKSAK